MEVGVIAAASAEPARAAADHIEALGRVGLRGIDLGVTIGRDPDELRPDAALLSMMRQDPLHSS